MAELMILTWLSPEYNLSWEDSRFFFTLDPDELETPWYRLFRGTLPFESKISRKPSPLNDALQAATVRSLAAKSKRQERMVLDVGKLTRAASKNDVSLGRNAGSFRRGRMDSGGLGVALPCDSYVGCGVIIRELTVTAFALNFLETAGIGVLSHVKKWVLHIVQRPGITCTSPSPLCDL